MSQRPIPGYFKDPQKILKEVKRLVKILINNKICLNPACVAGAKKREGEGEREKSLPLSLPHYLLSFDACYAGYHNLIIISPHFVQEIKINGYAVIITYLFRMIS